MQNTQKDILMLCSFLTFSSLPFCKQNIRLHKFVLPFRSINNFELFDALDQNAKTIAAQLCRNHCTFRWISSNFLEMCHTKMPFRSKIPHFLSHCNGRIVAIVSQIKTSKCLCHRISNDTSQCSYGCRARYCCIHVVRFDSMKTRCCEQLKQKCISLSIQPEIASNMKWTTEIAVIERKKHQSISSAAIIEIQRRLLQSSH